MKNFLIIALFVHAYVLRAAEVPLKVTEPCTFGNYIVGHKGQMCCSYFNISSGNGPKSQGSCCNFDHRYGGKSKFSCCNILSEGASPTFSCCNFAKDWARPSYSAFSCANGILAEPQYGCCNIALGHRAMPSGCFNVAYGVEAQAHGLFNVVLATKANVACSYCSIVTGDNSSSTGICNLVTGENSGGYACCNWVFGNNSKPSSAGCPCFNVVMADNLLFDGCCSCVWESPSNPAPSKVYYDEVEPPSLEIYYCCSCVDSHSCRLCCAPSIYQLNLAQGKLCKKGYEATQAPQTPPEAQME